MAEQDDHHPVKMNAWENGPPSPSKSAPISQLNGCRVSDPAIVDLSDSQDCARETGLQDTINSIDSDNSSLKVNIKTNAAVEDSAGKREPVDPTEFPDDESQTDADAAPDDVADAGGPQTPDPGRSEDGGVYRSPMGSPSPSHGQVSRQGSMNESQAEDGEAGELDELSIGSPAGRSGYQVLEKSPGGRYIKFNDKLGVGQYKTVWRAYDTMEGIEVAWCCVSLLNLPKQERARIKQEVVLLQEISHNNIINFYGSWLGAENKEVVFVTEILSGGSLKEFILKVRVIRWRIIKRWMKSILEGLTYLHSMDPPVIHRDLKCDNIFLNGNNNEIRIGDFGLSCRQPEGDKIMSVLGTPEFMAPELYDETYDEKVDIYAFGMCCLEMITKDRPYNECSNPAQIYKKVTQAILPKVLKQIANKQAVEFIELCLQSNSKDRPTAAELLQHAFLNSHDDDDVEIKINRRSTPLGGLSAVSEEVGESSVTPEPASCQVHEHSNTTGHAPTRKEREQEAPLHGATTGKLPTRREREDSRDTSTGASQAEGSAQEPGDPLPTPLQRAHSQPNSTNISSAPMRDPSPATRPPRVPRSATPGAGGAMSRQGSVEDAPQPPTQQGQSQPQPSSNSLSRASSNASLSSQKVNSAHNSSENLQAGMDSQQPNEGRHVMRDSVGHLAIPEHARPSQGFLAPAAGGQSSSPPDEIITERWAHQATDGSGGAPETGVQGWGPGEVTGPAQVVLADPSAIGTEEKMQLKLKVPLEGKVCEVEFEYHLANDDPLQVAQEMVQDLGIAERQVERISGTLEELASKAQNAKARAKKKSSQADLMNSTRGSDGAGGDGGGGSALSEEPDMAAALLEGKVQLTDDAAATDLMNQELSRQRVGSASSDAPSSNRDLDSNARQRTNTVTAGGSLVGGPVSMSARRGSRVVSEQLSGNGRNTSNLSNSDAADLLPPQLGLTRDRGGSTRDLAASHGGSAHASSAPSRNLSDAAIGSVANLPPAPPAGGKATSPVIGQAGGGQRETFDGSDGGVGGGAAGGDAQGQPAEVLADLDTDQDDFIKQQEAYEKSRRAAEKAYQRRAETLAESMREKEEAFEAFVRKHKAEMENFQKKKEEMAKAHVERMQKIENGWVEKQYSLLNEQEQTKRQELQANEMTMQAQMENDQILMNSQVFTNAHSNYTVGQSGTYSREQLEAQLQQQTSQAMPPPQQQQQQNDPQPSEAQQNQQS